uniref:Serpin domain-containing protein n=1 Tax=Sus scrofa TaxID=9823 RepID=A0A4X1U5U0_PIG
MSSLSESIIQFAVDLFQQIRRSEGGNIFYSPLSIMSALAMTYLGSRGHTASEIRKVGGFVFSGEFHEWTSSQNMKESQVDLHLPRFKVEENYKLMAKADADFSGMTGRRELAISSVVHKSFVEVTEEGTEAAAATGVVTGMTSAPLNNHFHCDHPFLFFIRHNKTNSILFCGRVSSP